MCSLQPHGRRITVLVISHNSLLQPRRLLEDPRIIFGQNNNNNKNKNADLDGRYTFEPIAIETLGVFNTSARQLLCDLGRKISENTGEVRETSFLFQRCSVLVQRFNAILLHDSLPAYDCTDLLFVPIFVFFQ